MGPHHTSRRVKALLLATALVLALTGCGQAAASGKNGPAADQGAAATLRLGYFPNVTHAPALVGIGEGYFQAALGATTLKLQAFNAGPSAIEALNAGAIDATFVGPSPALNAFVRSQGKSIRIVAGCTSGGAQLVVRDGINAAADLKGSTLAVPQQGGTQDVALRAWLQKQGLTFTGGGADVSVTPIDNAQTFQLFSQGRLDGGWLPEPWSSRLVLDAGAHVLVDEADLWPGGQFLTTVLIVRTDFLAAHPQTVTALLRGLVQSVDAIAADPATAQATVNAQIAAAAGQAISDTVIARAFEHLHFTVDPLAGTLQTQLANAVAVGATQNADLHGIYDLRLLNAVLHDAGHAPVTADGLGQE